LSSSKNNSELEKAGRNQLERHEKMTRMVGRIERMSMDVVRKWFVDISVHCTHEKRSKPFAGEVAQRTVRDQLTRESNP
jgi:hypothetical protein